MTTALGTSHANTEPQSASTTKLRLALSTRQKKHLCNNSTSLTASNPTIRESNTIRLLPNVPELLASVKPKLWLSMTATMVLKATTYSIKWLKRQKTWTLLTLTCLMLLLKELTLMRSKMRSAQACLTTSAHSTPALTKLPLAQLESLRKSKLSRSSYAQSSTVKSSSSELLSKSRLISVMDYLTHSTMTLSSTNSTTLLKDEYLVLRALYSMHSLI